MWFPLALIVLGVGVAFAQRLLRSKDRTRARSSAWMRWATARGHAFRRYDGSFQRRAGESVRGRHQGVDFELRLCRDGAHDDDARLVARVTARGHQLTTAPLDVYASNEVAEFQRAMLRQWIDFQGSSFGERWLVRGTRPDEAQELIGPSAQQRLLACDHVTHVHVEADRVELTFDGAIEDPAVLDRGIEAACGFFAERGSRRKAG
ncbi:MAG: hypothetical protein EPO68_14300 [Planctomycetota bacterium]|nr:MAG: hypothetical protein EPO68_14300 [Planctomycetota bacterium]